MKEYFIVLDQGSSSSRAFAVDKHGNIEWKAQKVIRASYPKNGWAEYDALGLLYSQLGALDECLRKIPPSARLVSMGIAAQRSTVVLWNRDTGMPVCPALSWQDGRAVKELDELDLNLVDIHYKTGLYKTPYYSASKILWCIKNYPEVKSALISGKLLVGPVTSFLIWHLTQGKVFAVDPTMAQRMLLFNIRTLDWDDSLLKAFDIPRSILPSIRPSFGKLGEFKKGNLRLPIMAAMGDQQAAVSGMGAGAFKTAAINYGTGAFLLLNTGEELHHVTGLLSSIGWQDSAGKCSYMLEGTVHSASATLDWLKLNLGLMKNIKDADKLCRKSSNRLMVLPALGGIGAPHWDYQTFTTMTGFTPQTKREDIVRGCVEGIAYLISDVAVHLRAHGLSISEVRASGGLSKLDYLLQFQANILQTDIMRMSQSETTAIGAALEAAKAAGVCVSDWHADKVEKVFKPLIPGKEAEKLLEGWKLFVENCKKMSRDIRSSES